MSTSPKLRFGGNTTGRKIRPTVETLRRVSVVAVTVLVIFSTVTIVVSIPSAATTATQTGLDSCTTITEPGEYVLTQDIENSDADICIDIRTSDVRLDGDGHVIDGTITRERFLQTLGTERPSTDVGIGISVNDSTPVSNVTITDVQTTEWRLGILGEGVSDVLIRDVTSRANGAGVWVDGANGTTVTTTDSSNNHLFGVVVGGGQAGLGENNTVVDTTASENGETGVRLFTSSNSTVRNVTATGNGLLGLNVFGSPNIAAENVLVADNDFSGNGYNGMWVAGMTESTFTNNNVAGTRGTYPVEIAPGGQAPPWSSAGVFVMDASGNTFVNTDARNQSTWTYFATNNSTNVVVSLQTDASAVSFEGRDIALGPAANVPVDAATDENATTVGDGLTVTNTSADSFIDLQVQWEEVPTEMVEPTDADVFTAPLVGGVGPPADLDDDGLYEDVNGDGQLDIRDVAVLGVIEVSPQQYDLQLSDAQVAAFDFDADGDFDEFDVVALARMILAEDAQ